MPRQIMNSNYRATHHKNLTRIWWLYLKRHNYIIANANENYPNPFSLSVRRALSSITVPISKLYNIIQQRNLIS